MLVVATEDGTVCVFDESASGPGGVGLKERRKFRVMLNLGRMTTGVSDHGVEGHRIVRVGQPQWYSISVSFPIAVVSVNGTLLAIKDSDNCFSTGTLQRAYSYVASWDTTTHLRRVKRRSRASACPG